MNTLIKTRNILNNYGIRANKRYGQNFLIDDNILDNIVQAGNISSEDLIIEIGPGLGNLTEYIIDKARYMMLVEIDNNMTYILKDRFKENDNYMLLNNDILKINIDEEIAKLEVNTNIKFSNIKVIANLPYYITSPIIFKLLQDSKRISEIIVMVQKEVAERMVAGPGTKAYGVLSLMVQYLSDCDIEFIVPKESFIPAPEVTSAVVSLKKMSKYSVKNEEVLIKLIHMSFAQRRKRMVNSLYSSKFMGMAKDDLEKLLQKNGLDINTRAEQLTLQDYINITNSI